MNEIDLNSRKKTLCDEVLRKIGRNVLLFQQIEYLLKFLAANSNVDCTTTNFVEQQQKQTEDVQMKTMGTLIKHYKDSILSDAGEFPENSQEGISFKFTVTGDNSFYESQRNDLDLMVDERNNLIHHFLPRWQPDSIESLMATASYLDQQRETVLPMFEHLKTVTKAMHQARQKSVEFLASDEYERLSELHWLLNSPLVLLLKDVAMQKARPDGWAYLSQAGQLARIREPDAVNNIREQYGYTTLKQLLLASTIFDVIDEPLSNGGFRTIYQMKQTTKNSDLSH